MNLITGFIRTVIVTIVSLIFVLALVFFVMYQMGMVDRYLPKLACLINGGHKSPEIIDLGNNQIAKIVYKIDCSCDTIIFEPTHDRPSKP